MMFSYFDNELFRDISSHVNSCFFILREEAFHNFACSNELHTNYANTMYPVLLSYEYFASLNLLFSKK